jgi:hypothetical protein
VTLFIAVPVPLLTLCTISHTQSHYTSITPTTHCMQCTAVRPAGRKATGDQAAAAKHSTSKRVGYKDKMYSGLIVLTAAGVPKIETYDSECSTCRAAKKDQVYNLIVTFGSKGKERLLAPRCNNRTCSGPRVPLDSTGTKMVSCCSSARAYSTIVLYQRVAIMRAQLVSLTALSRYYVALIVTVHKSSVLAVSYSACAHTCH